MRKNILITLVRDICRRIGFDIVRCSSDHKQMDYPIDFSDQDINLINKVRPFTATSPERIYSLCAAVRYVVSHQIPGDIVECGVWKGGSIMAAMLTLLELGDTSRHLYLFDTFEGMTGPSEHDVALGNRVALDIYREKQKNNGKWVYSPIEEVKNRLYSVEYDHEKIQFVKGRVEDTLPDKAPQTISLLRLDTDWYESTRHELIHLFPRLSKGGVIIIDDYGEWAGARKATNEYMQQNNIKIFLSRIDYTGRIGIKL